MIKKITTNLKNKVQTHKHDIIGCALISVGMIIAYTNGRNDGGTCVLKWLMQEYPDESKTIINDMLVKRNSRK